RGRAPPLAADLRRVPQGRRAGDGAQLGRGNCDPLVKRALTAVVELAFHRPVAMLLGLVAIAFAALWVAGHLGFRGDFIELLPEDSYEVKNLRFVEQRAGGSGYLVVQLTGGDAPGRRAFAAQLAARLEQERTFV